MAGYAVQQIVDEVRTLSGLRRSTYFSDIEISEMVADGGKELADIFIAAYEHHFQTSIDFTLAGGVGANKLTLPDDFQKENMLLLNPALDAPEQVPFLGSHLERAPMAPGVFAWPGGGRRALIADNSLEVLPPSMAAGSYRLLYTPQFSNIAYPRTPDFTVGVATMDNVPMSPVSPEYFTTWNLTVSYPWVQNGVAVASLSPPYMLFNAQADPTQNGVYVVSVDNIGHTANAFRLTSLPGHPAPTLYPFKGQTVRVTGGTLGAGYYVETATVTPIVPPADNRTDPKVFAPPSLPAALAPWARYLKVYAALTVRRGRQQPAADLAAELEMLKARARKMATNRTEAPKQAPMTRGRLPWWQGGIGGWR